MATLYKLENSLTPVDADSTLDPDSYYFEVMTSDEIDDHPIFQKSTKAIIHNLLQEQNCSIITFPDSVIGSFVVLDRKNLLIDQPVFLFRLCSQKLRLVDDSNLCAEVIANLQKMEVKKPLTPAHVLIFIFRSFIQGDSAFLTSVEDELDQLEEDILGNNKEVNSRVMMQYRKRIFKLNAFYEQLSDVSEELSQDELGIISDKDQELFGLFTQQIDRLYMRTKSLREYHLQLRELFQSQTDLQLNKTMRILTVVATIFIPLTLLTSWYGMNFSYMPEIEWEYGYIVVILIAIVMIVVELIYFKKKKWL